MASDDQVINSISNSLGDLENTLARFIAKTEAASKKFGDAMKKMPPAAQGAAQGVEKAFKGSSSAAANLSFQLNDIGMMMASGQNPFMLMIQQGSQVSQIMGEIQRGGGSVGQVLKGAFTQLVNPMGLVSMALIGLTAYAVQYFTTVEDGGKEAEKALKEQEALINGVAQEWGDLLPTLQAIRKEQKEMAAGADKKAATKLASKEVYEDLGNTLDKLAPKIDGINVRLDESSQARTPAALATGYQALQRSVDDGSASLEQFDAVITKLQSLPEQTPAVQELTFELQKQRGVLADAAEKTAKLREEERLATAEKKALAEMTDKMNKMTGVQAKGLDAITKVYLDYMESIRLSTDHLNYAIKAAEAYNKAVSDFKHEQMVEGMEEMAKFGPELSKFEGFMQAYAKAINNAESEQDKLNVTTKGFLALQDQIATAGQTWGSMASKMGGVWTNYWDDRHEEFQGGMEDLEAYLAQIDQAEGRIRNKRSTAVGFGQFINSTWIGEIKQHRPDLAAAAGFDDAEILKLRSNVALAKEITRDFAMDNMKDLQSAGEKATIANLHLAHFLGSAGAIKVLQAAPGTPVKGLLSDDAIRSNPEVLGGGATVEDAIAYAQGRAKVAGAVREEKDAVADLTAQMNEQIESQLRQNEINKDSTKSVDEKTFALLKEEAMTKLMAAARADGTEATKAEIAAFDTLSSKMASAGLSADQLKTKEAELKKQQDDLKSNTEALAQQYNDMASQAISGFINDMRHGVSAGEAFSKMLDTLIGQLIEMAIKAMVMKSGLGAALAGVTGGASGGFLFKSGGTIGFTGNAKGTVSGRSFAGAQSMASGGIMGDPNAIPIIGHRGEIVIPTDALRKAATSTRQPQQTSIDARSTVNVDIANGTGTTNVTSQGGVNFASMLDRAVQGIIVRESRPGGLLRAGMPGERR